MTRGCVRWIVILLGVGDGPCGGLEDGHQETEGVPLEGRCGNTLPRRMRPLTDKCKAIWAALADLKLELHGIIFKEYMK